MALSVTWSEQAGYRAATERAQGRCELTRVAGKLEHHHRVRRAQGVDHAPWNLLVVTPAVHDWFHVKPDRAKAGGWLLEGGGNPAGYPVYLWPADWFDPGWVLLRPADDGGPHIAELVDPQHWLLPPYPAELPPGFVSGS